MTTSNLFLVVTVLVTMIYMSSSRPDSNLLPKRIDIFPDDVADAEKNHRARKDVMDSRFYVQEGNPIVRYLDHPDALGSESGDYENSIDHVGNEDYNGGDPDESDPQIGNDGDPQYEEEGGIPTMEKDPEGSDGRQEGADEEIEGDGSQPGGGFMLGNPILSLKIVNEYFFKLERAMQKIFQETLAEAMGDENAFTNTTDEIVDIGGRKYKVHKTLLKSGDENSSVLMEAISSQSMSNKTEE